MITLSYTKNIQTVLIEAEGNKPLLLKPSKGWFIQSGKADLFIVQVFRDQSLGNRNYLLSVEQGESFFGLAPRVTEEGEFAILAVGQNGSQWLEFDIDQMSALTLEEDKKEANSQINNWINKWNTTEDQSDFTINWTEASISSQLDIFHKGAFGEKLEALFEERKNEIHRRKLQEDKDKAHMSSGLLWLMNTLNRKEKVDIDADDINIDNLLYKACRAVGKAKKMKIVASSELKKNNPESKDLLGDIARASQMRTREIILKDIWWKEDNGALLVFREEDDQPMALLPLSPTKYVLYNPADESQLIVDADLADTIRPHAYTFYRPLPAKNIGYKELLKYLFDGIWKSDAYWVLIMGVLGGALGVLTPIVTGIIFDKVIPDGEKLLLIQIGFLMMAIAITTFAFNLTRSFAMQRIEGKTEADLQAAVWDRLLSLPVPFFKDYSSGELTARTMGISQIRAVLSGAVANTLISGIFSIFYFALLFYYSWKLALIATAIVLFVMGISLVFGFYQLRFERQLVDLNNKLSGKVFGLLSGVSKIKTSGAEKRVFHNWAKDFSQVRDITFSKEIIGNRMAIFNSTVNILATGIIFYALIKMESVNLAAGKFISFNSAFSSFLGAMLQISSVILQVNVIKPLYERVKPILDTIPEYDQEKADPGELQGNIEVSHVNFRYDKDGPLILDDVVVNIQEGDYVGVVGPSGSGKSTLFRLLLGFEKAESGQIYYDNQDLESVDIRSIRRQLGVVLQSGQLMQGSIFDNIVGANPGLNQEDAWEAARKAGMEDDIKSMPMGMHTVVTEGGGTLSGGQKQRLLIARAIISNPKIVYFDEATSALDNKTQKIVSDSLSNLGATRIVIAHRLSTIVNCTKIIVLDRGKVVEQGGYQELYEKGGLFTELVKRQLA